MHNMPPERPAPRSPIRHPFLWVLHWLRVHWRQPNPHAESKLHRACRDFARHFRALRVQFPVFYVLGGLGVIVATVLAASEHLDNFAIAEWGIVGLVGPPAIVCFVLFLVLRWTTPTKQRDEARGALGDKDKQIVGLTATIRSLERGPEDVTPRVSQQISIETVERLEIHGGAAELLAAQLLDRYEVGAPTSEPPREPQPQLELDPQPDPQPPPERSDQDVP
jgi:hypothetical protein